MKRLRSILLALVLFSVTEAETIDYNLFRDRVSVKRLIVGDGTELVLLV